ncbi:hypothetical protein D3C72_2352050 [compost metagenome]
MVLGVGRVDGHERQGAPVFTLRHVGRCCGFCLVHYRLRENVRDAVRIDGDHGDRLFAGDRADDIQHLRTCQAKTVAAQDVGFD